MEKIHILTDSSADIPQAQVEAHGIEIVPITLTHEGRTIREYYDITPRNTGSCSRTAVRSLRPRWSRLRCSWTPTAAQPGAAVRT